jgi:2-polyprenyl-6-methoxyphenol hydroxylase-like FAD-dependent oxidoreductase
MNSEVEVTDCDVVVVGGGLAGTATASILARRGMSVVMVDRYREFPPLFRAEKIEPDQVDLLRRLDLFDVVEPKTRLITEIIHARKGRTVYRRPIEQFGISYSDIVNQVRAGMPQRVDLRIGIVKTVAADDRRPSVTLEDGTRIEGRLVVIATGMADRFALALGASRHFLMKELSMAFGFMIEPDGAEPFAFDAVTYKPASVSDNVGYLTLFRMGSFMRANFFAYWAARDELSRDMVRDPKGCLGRVLAGLEQVIGPYKVTGKVEPFRIDLYRLMDCAGSSSWGMPTRACVRPPARASARYSPMWTCSATIAFRRGGRASASGLI